MRTAKKTLIAVSAAIALAGFGATPAFAVPAPTASIQVDQTLQVRYLILSQTNQLRAAAGLPALQPSAPLDAFAQQCTQQQADARSIFHCAPPADFDLAWGENVAYGYSPEQVVTG